MNIKYACLVLPMLLGGVTCQEQATTLLALSQRAEVVVVARAERFAEPAPDVLAVRFQRLEALRGSSEAEFILQEPAGRCCGRALFQLAPGSTRVLFLERHAGELHLIGGDRGLVEATPALLSHLRSLLQAGTIGQRAEELARALQDSDRRVRRDAAHALAQLPSDVLLSGTARAALRAAVTAGLLDETSLLPALLQAGERHDPDATLALVLPAYLQAQRAEVQGLLQQRLQAQPPASVCDTLLLHWPQQESARQRAAELLATLPATTAEPMQLRLLREAQTPRTALPLCRSLLQHGMPPQQLQALAPAVVLQLAERQRAEPPGFRSIRPQR